MNKQKIKAFTLVELIVVITILVILGTIAFVSLKGYSASARDSKRISDIQNIKKSLELFSINTGKYPIPDNGLLVKYVDDLLRTQGIVGDNVSINLSKNLQKKPTDPLTETEYTYSTINTQNEYQLLSVYESDLISYNNLLNLVNADQVYVKLDGTYNGFYVKSTNYYVPTPSIINSEASGTGIIINEDNIKSQIVTGGDNLLTSGITEAQTGGLNITLSVYEGTITKDSTSNEKILLAEALQTAYSGSELINQDIYKTIVETPENELESIVDLLVLKDSSYSLSSTQTYIDCDFNGEVIIHNAEVTAYETESVEFGNFCNSEQRICNNGELSGTFTFTGCIINGAIGTFNLSQTSVEQGTNVTIIDNCSVSPTSYTSSNTGVATVSGNTITTISAGTTNIMPVGGACADINSKNLTVTAPLISQVYECSNVGQIGKATTKYGLCDKEDIIVCSGNGVGYTVAACNVGTNISGITSSSYGDYIQFGKTNNNRINGEFNFNYDWKSPGGTDAGSANDWGVEEVEKTTAIYSNQNPIDQAKMQGPCNIGYHVPTQKEWLGLINAGDWLWNSPGMIETLKLPKAGLYRRNAYILDNVGGIGYYRSSSPNSNESYYLNFESSTVGSYIRSIYRSNGISVRCFKN